MKTNRLMAALGGAAMLLLPLNLALAHGPGAFPGFLPAPAPVPAPFVPEGGGAPEVRPVGGGSGTPTPGGPEGGEFEPAGGGATPAPEPEPAPAPAPAPAPEAGSTPPVAPPTVNPGLPGGLSGAGLGQTPRSGAPGQRTRPKSQLMPWAHRVRIDWTPVFPFSINGYDADTENPSAGLKVSPEAGGWARKNRPSLLVIWDPTSKAHQRALKRLQDDARVKHASHLFNCFRMDARALGRRPGEIVLEVFDIDGKRVGKTQGQKRLRKVFSLLEQGLGRKGAAMGKLTAYVQSLLNAMAYCDHHMDQMSRQVICIDCGHERVDIAEAIDQMKERKLTLGRALAKITDQ